MMMRRIVWMIMRTARLLGIGFLAVSLCAPGFCAPDSVSWAADAAQPPAGFIPLFNGRDLAGWRGRPHLDPRKDAEGTAAEREARQRGWDENVRAHWQVVDGEIVGDGKGVFLTTDRDFGDFELHLDWLLAEPGVDSGIYLRGNPQVQLWDPDCERDFKHGCQKGSGGLWNNPADSPGKFPLVKADRPIGEWNNMQVRMVGDRVTVHLNDTLVVDDQPLANFFEKAAPLPARGPIQIQTHGGPLRVRNIVIRELGTFDLSGPGWRPLGVGDFVDVNCGPETWAWNDDSVVCTGRPVGVIRTREPLTNLEMSLEWRHLTSGGNSGVFLWAPPEALASIKPGQLPPGGIEVQVLDHGFTEQYEKSGRKADWFTTDGDVFPVGASSMKPFPPVAPGGKRSFPSARHSLGTPEWNHYFVRAVAGEVRLWVNGHGVSGGSDCRPATGYLCLESEGAPVEFRRLRLRELPAAGETGFLPLFDGRSLAGWQGATDGYEVVEGEIRSKPGVGGSLLTTREYGDFILRFDFRLTPGANNGLGIRQPGTGDGAFAGIELQILDDAHPKYAGIQPWQAHGSIYGVVAAERGCLEPAGEWNTEEVTVVGTTIKVVVNGKTIVDADVAPFRDGAQPTLDGKAHPGLARTAGHIGFLGHHDEVHFRNIRIKPLP